MIAYKATSVFKYLENNKPWDTLCAYSKKGRDNSARLNLLHRFKWIRISFEMLRFEMFIRHILIIIK